MHGSTRDGLEELLAASGAVGCDRQMREHLSACPECVSDVKAMKTQSDLLQLLRTPEEVEPSPGFYARVLQRIEERAKGSIWSVFIYSPFGKRLVFASLTVAAALGTYVVTQESQDGHLRGFSVMVQDAHDDALVEGNQAQQRDAVLANFASHDLATAAVSQEGLRR